MAVDTTTSSSQISQKLQNEARNAFFKALFTFGAILFLGVAFWIIVEVFIIEDRPSLPAEVVAASRRFDSSLNTDMIDVMEFEKVHFSNAALANFSIFLADEEGLLGTDGSMNIFEMPFQNPRPIFGGAYSDWLHELGLGGTDEFDALDDQYLDLEDLEVEEAVIQNELPTN